MKKSLIGAASLSALMAVGLAACGQNSATYGENDADAAAEQSNEYAQTQPADAADGQTQAYAANGQTDDEYASDDQPMGSDSMTDDETSAATSARTSVADRMKSAAADAASSGPLTLASFSSVRTRSEVEDVAQDVFAKADTNGDGKLDRAEYVAVALAGSKSTMIPEGDTATTDETASIGGAAPDAAEGDATTAETTTAEMAGESQVASVDEQQKAEEAFADAAGEGESMSLEQMREAFLARFDEADSNSDQQLDTLERMKFARLVAGEEATQ